MTSLKEDDELVDRIFQIKLINKTLPVRPLPFIQSLSV